MQGEYFGVDVSAQMVDWWRKDFLERPIVKAMRRGKDGQVRHLVTVILDPFVQHNWQSPFGHVLLKLDTSHEDGAELDKFSGETSLDTNVAGKLRFCLRTGQDSIFAETNPDLLLSGDFPWEGGLFACRGYTGGTSGLDKHDDALVTEQVIDQLKHVRAVAARPSVERSGDYRNQPNPALAKYLGASPLSAKPISRDWFQAGVDLSD